MLSFLTPTLWVGCDTRSIFKFFFSQTSCLIEAKEPSLPYYFPIAGGRTDGFMPFPEALAQSERQTV